VIKTEIRKRAITVTLSLLLVVILPVFAYMYTTQQQIPTGVVIETPTVEIGVYWDYACTQPVTRIDIGAVIQPNNDLTIWKTLYIKNEGTVPLTFFWGSNVSLVADEKIREDLYRWGLKGLGLNGTTIEPNQLWDTRYEITLAPYITVGTYNWTLTIWGVY